MKKRHFILAKCYDKRGKLLGKGTNSYKKTHPLQKFFATFAGLPLKIYLHAEVAAILQCKNRKIHRISIERFDKHGQPVNAKPCLICQEAIKAFGIQVVEHT